MKSFFLTELVLFVSLAIFALDLRAQTDGVRAADRPFQIGETLTYVGKVRKIIQGIEGADLTFTVGKGAGNDNYLITARATSKGTLTKLFRFSFLQNYESTIDAVPFRALKSVHHDVQKERVRDSQA